MKADESSSDCPDCGAPIPDGAPGGLCPRCLLVEAAVETATLPANGPVFSLEAIAEAFPNLDVIEQIGAGGMGSVYKVRQKRLDRLVALKLLRCHPDDEEAFASRFLREARALARLNHPNIVTIYEFGEAQGFYYLLMEYVDGVDLRQAMAHKRLSPKKALKIVPKICEALHYAHGQGVLHRDIKPANILLEKSGGVKVADFGLAKFVSGSDHDQALTRTEMSLGTPAYMAPEQLEHPDRVDHRADIYSLGVVFYEMLTGELPLGRFSAPSLKSPSVEGVDKVVLRTLEKEPEARYQSAEDVQSDVSQLRWSSKPEPADPGTAGSADTGSPAGSNRFCWKGIFGAILVLLSLPPAAFFLQRFLFPPSLSDDSYAELQILLLVIGSVVGLVALVGTLFGIAALQTIHRDPSRYAGLILALLAAMTWPIMILAGLVAGLIRVISGNGLSLGAVVVFALTITAALGWGMVRRTWHWALTHPAKDPGQRNYWWWIFAGMIVACAVMMSKGKMADRERDESPLVTAAAAGDSATVARLLAAGTELNQRSAAGDTALIGFAKRGDVAGVRQFIQRGADIDAKNKFGLTPLLVACGEGHAGVVSALAEANASLDERLPNGANALHLAAHAGHGEVVRYLLQLGMAVDPRNLNEQSPLLLACDGGHLEPAEILLGAGASVDIIDEGGRSALALAATSGSIPLMAKLLEAGAGLDGPDASGQTPLAHAVASGHDSAAEWLLRQGAAATPNWHLAQAFRAATAGRWNETVQHLRNIEEQLDPSAGNIPSLKFGNDGWSYSCQQPAIAIPALLAEASMRAGERGGAEAAAKRSLQACPDGMETRGDLDIIVRSQDRGGNSRIERLFLATADEIEIPIKSGNGDTLAHLSTTSRTWNSSSSHVTVITTFFR